MEIRGYILDSYRQDQSRIETSKAIGTKLFENITEWEYIDTPKKFEMECGENISKHQRNNKKL